MFFTNQGKKLQFEYNLKSFDIEGVSENDHIYKQILLSGTFYEISLLEYIYKVKPFITSKKYMNVVIDVGANIGNHSIFLRSFLADHLISIEPNPNVIPQLRRNLSKNIDNYTLLECAVGDKESRGGIVVPELMGNNIGAAQINECDDEGDIEISTIDSIFSNWESGVKSSTFIPLIKIDVEGMECQVLKGAEKTIIKYRPHIFAEAATKDNFQKIYHYLRPLGYRRLPGRWAATPVYHFAFKPELKLIMITSYWEFRRRLKKIKLRLKKFFV